MTRDAELDKLKAAQQSAFERKQRAYSAQQSAWEVRKNAGAAQARAYDRQQSAFERQNAAWAHLQSVKSANTGRIDSLNAQQERAYQNMKSAFESASVAHACRDGASAKSYAEQGHAYKAESQQCVAERRRLVDEIRTASAALRDCKPDTARAKAEFQSTRAAFQDAKARHEHLQREFQDAKTAFECAKDAFQARLKVVREQHARSNQEIAARAGVPFQYLNDVRVRYDAAGIANIYFGGVGAPDGPGHGHYAIDQSGKVTYKRDPFDPHGSHNFADSAERRQRIESELARRAMDQWAKTQVGRREVQHLDDDFRIEVQSGYSRNADTVTTDVLIFDRRNKTEHYHIILDPQGDVLWEGWRDNHA